MAFWKGLRIAIGAEQLPKPPAPVAPRPKVFGFTEACRIFDKVRARFNGESRHVAAFCILETASLAGCQICVQEEGRQAILLSENGMVAVDAAQTQAEIEINGEITKLEEQIRDKRNELQTVTQQHQATKEQHQFDLNYGTEVLNFFFETETQKA